jgi:eukaryotic-like serine/threonine-protein kinase
MVGEQLSHYRILEPLGQGGMGVVYRAFDERLERDVALKVLPDASITDGSAREQLRREALALSRVNHPGIATIHELGHDRGIDFIVMEYVEGATLEGRLLAGPMPEGELAGIALAIAEALEAAHAQGIVHRDLKPANVALTASGRVKVLDFGIAALRGRPAPAVTETKNAPESGTLRYMAPEQLMGAGVDARSDLYALGVILYEMAVGRPPHGATLATALVYEIINTPPPPPGTARPDLSRALERLILRCLEKDPTKRPPSAVALADELRRVLTTPANPTPAHVDASPAAGIRSLVVLPLENLSGDPSHDFFADGMTDALISELAQLSALRVISRTSAMRYKGARKPTPEIGRELNVQAVVEGSVVRSGDRVRITAQLVDAAADRALWSKSYQRDLSDVLELQSALACEIADEIRVTLSPRERERLNASRSVDPAAYDAYLRGRYYWNRRTDADVRRSIEYFMNAIDIDPRYAIAYVGLADAYNILGTNSAYLTVDAFPRAKAAALQAIEIDPERGEAHVSLAYTLQYHDWNWKASEREYKVGLEKSPNYAPGHQWYGLQLSTFGRFDEALAETERARTLDPLSPVLATSYADVLYYARRFEEAKVELDRVLEADPRFAPGWLDMGRLELQLGHVEEGIAAYRRSLELTGSDPDRTPYLALAYALAGDHAEARRRLDVLLGPPRRSPAWSIASVYAALGDRERALEWLERGFEERGRAMVTLAVHPRFDVLRGEPRMQALVAELNLPVR